MGPRKHRVRQVVRPLVSSILVIFLAVGLMVSCFLLVMHAYEAPKVEYGVAGELLLVAVLSVEGIVAVRHLRQARLESVHEVLVSIMDDYRSAEMLLAINTLWRFHSTHGDQFVQVYLDRWRADDDRIAALPEHEQLAAMSATLHYHRRMVKEFFNLLAGLYELGVFPKEMLYTYWSEADLKIIPEILIPLETAVATKLRTEMELGGWFRRLRRLYVDRMS